MTLDLGELLKLREEPVNFSAEELTEIYQAIRNSISSNPKEISFYNLEAVEFQASCYVLKQ